MRRPERIERGKGTRAGHTVIIMMMESSGSPTRVNMRHCSLSPASTSKNRRTVRLRYWRKEAVSFGVSRARRAASSFCHSS